MSPLIRGHCPYCNRAGVSNMAKRLSSREHPAQCTLCGNWSHITASSRSGIPWFSFVFGMISTIIGLGSSHVLLGALAGIVIAVIYNIWAWRRVELWPISPESVANAKAAGWVVSILAVLGILGQ